VLLLFGCAGRFYLQPTIDLIVAQAKEFPYYFQDLSVYIHERNRNVTFFRPSSKYFGMSIKQSSGEPTACWGD